MTDNEKYEVIAAHRSMMMGVAMNYMKNQMDAEDVVSDATIRALKYFDKYDPEKAKFSTWIVQVTINCALQVFRSKKNTEELDDRIPAPLEGQSYIEDWDYVVDLHTRIIEYIKQNELLIKHDLVSDFIAYYSGGKGSTSATKGGIYRSKETRYVKTLNLYDLAIEKGILPVTIRGIFRRTKLDIKNQFPDPNIDFNE